MTGDVKQRFSQYAHGYVTSETHSQGHDLDRLIELAQPQPDWVVLDVATGGGHTALKFAPHVAKVIASDFAPPMLAEAKAFIESKGVTNIEFAEVDAENIPYPDATFDLVTCRVAPHHFADAFKFVQESARVLKPGGLLLVQDHLNPDDDKAAEYLEAFERLRDPSHNRVFNSYEWQGLYLDAGLTVEHWERISREASFVKWVERQECPPEVRERLEIMIIQAPDPVKEWMNFQCAGTPDATLDHAYIIILGKKPA